MARKSKQTLWPKFLQRPIVKSIRALLGWTQQDLADRLQTPLATIARFEAGGPIKEPIMIKMVQLFCANSVGFVFDDRRKEVVGAFVITSRASSAIRLIDQETHNAS